MNEFRQFHYCKLRWYKQGTFKKDKIKGVMMLPGKSEGRKSL